MLDQLRSPNILSKMGGGRSSEGSSFLEGKSNDANDAVHICGPGCGRGLDTTFSQVIQ